MRAVVGLQAQVASAAELMLWARTEELQRGALDHLLWESRKLVKTWAMRGTLHVLPPADAGLLGAARGGYDAFPANWLQYYKMTRAEFDALIEATRSVLSAEPLTRAELAERVAAMAGPALGARLLSSWGEFLKPLSREGALVNGPPRRGQATFVSAEAWIGPQKRWTPAAAAPEALRRYLAAWGPATRADYLRWLGMRVGAARLAWEPDALGLAEVSVDGRPAWVRAEDLQELLEAAPDNRVRLLGPFDTWLLGHVDRSHLFTAAQRPLVSRTAGWISAVVLRGGRVAGTWTYRKGGRGLEVAVTLFESLPAAGRRQLKAEAERLEAFLGGPLALTIA